MKHISLKNNWVMELGHRGTLVWEYNGTLKLSLMVIANKEGRQFVICNILYRKNIWNMRDRERITTPFHELRNEIIGY